MWPILDFGLKLDIPYNNDLTMVTCVFKLEVATFMQSKNTIHLTTDSTWEAYVLGKLLEI